MSDNAGINAALIVFGVLGGFVLLAGLAYCRYRGNKSTRASKNSSVAPAKGNAPTAGQCLGSDAPSRPRVHPQSARAPHNATPEVTQSTVGPRGLEERVVFADSEQVAFKLRVGFGRAGERIRAAARLLVSLSPSSLHSSSPNSKLSNPDTVEWTAPRRELTTPRGQGAEPRRDQHSRSVRPLDLFEVSGEPGMPEQAEATEPTLYGLEVPPNVRPGMKLKLSLPGRVQKVVITVPAGAAPGRIISVSMLHNKVEARVKLHELTLAVESARLVATSNALEHAHNAPVQLPIPVDRFEDEHANTGTGSRLLTAPSPPAQLLSPAPHVRLAELEREMERRDSARLARLLERDAEQRTSAPLVRLSELELRLAARAQIAQTIDSPDIMRPESPELSLVNLDARSADWLTHTHSVSCLLSESSRGGSESGLNPAELRETASPRPSLSRPISACSASSSASSAYEDAAGSSAFEDADEYVLDEFHDVEQEYYAAARIQAVARGKSNRRDSPVLMHQSPVLTRDSPERWRELELWRELGDVLISINGAEPSVEELSAALHSHGGSLESLATYARTDHSALTEELKRLGFSKIDLRKKVEQSLVEMPKAPSIAGDLQAGDLQAGAPEAAMLSHGTPVPTVRSFGRKLEQKSKPFWELQHKSEPFGGELQQGGASPAKASTSAAASDSTPAPARKPQSPSGSSSLPPGIETPTMTPGSLRSDLFKWLQNEELMDDLNEPEEPGLPLDSKPASSLSPHSRTDNAVSPRGERTVAFQGAHDPPVDISSATELGRGQSFERVSRGSSKPSISSSKLSFKRTARLSKEVVKSLSFKRSSRKPSNKETIERAASMRV